MERQMFNRILIAVDGLPTFNKTLTTALRMAREAICQVRLVRVIDELDHGAGYVPYGGSSANLIRIMQQTGAKVLNDAMQVATSVGASADKLLLSTFANRFDKSAAELAKAWGALLTVVGTHGRRHIGGPMLGRCVEQITCFAQVPVLLVLNQPFAAPESASG
jgi:nucleotide-binding universal stress UspA family protein